MPITQKASPDAIWMGAMIRVLREQKQWSREELAKRTGMNLHYVGRVERGQNLPSIPLLMRLAPVFGLRASDLVRALEDRQQPTAAK